MNKSIKKDTHITNSSLELARAELREVNEKKGLSFSDRDDFLRAEIAENIVKLLASNIAISPLVIDGNWGIGKSEFCVKLAGLASDTYKNWKIGYIDAFKSDHSNDSLIVLIASILELVQNESDRNNLIEKSVAVLRILGGTMLKGVFGHLVKANFDHVSGEIQEAMTNASDAIIDKTLENMLEKYENASKTILGLRNVLSEIGEVTPIVIFVDELDRCRPDYALSFIENIKHIFDVPGVKIVLVCNTEQLTAASKHRYGSDVNADEYLQKFIKYKIELSEDAPIGDSFKRNTIIYFQKLIKDSQIDENIFEPVWAYKKCTIDRILNKKHSLRDIEHLVTNLEVFNLLTGEDKFIKNEKFGMLTIKFLSVYIFTFKKDLTREILNGTLAVDQVLDLFSKKSDFKSTDLRERRDITMIATYLYKSRPEYISFTTPSFMDDIKRVEGYPTYEQYFGDRIGSSLYDLKRFLNVLSFNGV